MAERSASEIFFVGGGGGPVGSMGYANSNMNTDANTNSSTSWIWIVVGTGVILVIIGIIIAFSLSGKSLIETGYLCEKSSDCKNGACGYQTSVSSYQICCKSAAVTIPPTQQNSYCTGNDTGAACLNNAMCTSNVCTNSKCT